MRSIRLKLDVDEETRSLNIVDVTGTEETLDRLQRKIDDWAHKRESVESSTLIS